MPSIRSFSTPKSQTLLQNKIRKRRNTIFRKLEDLRLCGARIYFVIEQNNRYFTFNSGETNWPPSPRTIEMSYPLPKEYGPGTGTVYE
ncbi:hypothetical protein PspLS_10903 [Pyricularia sp. CBS 133598]|nr:hypothetical protein PspLS_10903 [Pyricularia sp. CBS 133598]